MPETTTNKTNEFVVKESASTNLIIGTVFLMLFIFTLSNFLNKDHMLNPYASKTLYCVLFGTFSSAVGFIIHGFMHKTIITVNKDGFYFAGTLKTNWDNFISAEVTEMPVTGSYQDHFVLLVRYYNEAENGDFESQIPMQDTYDKSGEEVVDAIKKIYEAANIEKYNLN